MPGGCAIGTRPVDLLIMAMERLGAEIEIDGGYVVARAPNGLKGGEIVFPKVTVGGTHTAIMAASLASGTTRDRERRTRTGDRRRRRLPQQDGRADRRRRHVADRYRGRCQTSAARATRCCPTASRPAPTRWRSPWPAATFCCRTRGPRLLQAALDVLGQTGVTVTPTNEGIRVSRDGAGLRPVEVTTAPFPAFPTDLQAQLMALMTRAQGTSHIVETVFENRFMHVQELARLGARIHLEGEKATIEGVRRLKGAPVMATDLRASVSLVIAATGRRRRDHRQPHLPSRPRVRAAGRQARTLRRRHRTAGGIDDRRPAKAGRPRRPGSAGSGGAVQPVVTDSTRRRADHTAPDVAELLTARSVEIRRCAPYLSRQTLARRHCRSSA